MKKKFHAYYKPTQEEFDSLWKEALIVFDANVLLNLYTYSLETREEFLRLLSEMKERIWLPYQAAEEYHHNRCGIINKEAKRYEDIQDNLSDILKALGSRKGHPFIEDNLLKRFEKLSEKIKKSLMTGKDEYTSFIRTDPIRDKVTDIFNGRVGEPFSPEDLGSIYSEGKDRFLKKVPPGYEDKDKQEPDRYGDFVLWKEVIKISCEIGKGIILVTDDSKKDWWNKFNGEKLGPRPELLHEFQLQTGNEIYIYSSDLFLEKAKEYGKVVSDMALKELEDAKIAREAQEISRSQEEALVNKLKQVDMHNRSIGNLIKGSMLDEKSLQSALKEMNKNLLPIIDPEVLQKFLQVSNPIPLTAYNAMLSAISEANINPVINPRITEGLLGLMFPPLQYKQEKNKLVENIKEHSQNFKINERFVPDDKNKRPSENNLTEDITSEGEEEINEGDDEQE